ncbi:hypothetical protein EDC04DRAFT_2762424 [Pisolithus marmoratus]|nr:hypothetical protein EDC04DRAFT_2767853 [Pisolithus marmoratus]KAI6012055.1 hypothetical protein EDC04DRAFT_2762424 [Pisolithus marmoratus]
MFVVDKMLLSLWYLLYGLWSHDGTAVATLVISHTFSSLTHGHQLMINGFTRFDNPHGQGNWWPKGDRERADSF